MKTLLALSLATVILISGCSSNNYELPEKTITGKYSLTTTKFSSMPAKLGGTSVTAIKFDPVPSSCAIAHMSTVWYTSDEITICWDKNGNEEHYNLATSDAFTIGVAFIGAISGFAIAALGVI